MVYAKYFVRFSSLWFCFFAIFLWQAPAYGNAFFLAPLVEEKIEDISLFLPESLWAGEAFFFKVQGQGLERVSLTWNKRELVFPTGQGQLGACEGLLSVALDEQQTSLPVTFLVTVKGRTRTISKTLAVQKREYPVQRLTVAKKHVNPPASEKARIEKDRKSLNAALAGVSPRQGWSLPLLRPVPGDITSVYGLRRVFNGEERSPHKGLDFDGAANDPILACAPGLVVLAEDQYYGGNMVVLDHGLGVFSLYLHMSSFPVTVGQQVGQGATIGYIGSTGRSTGPHLHLSLSVLGTSINPLPLLDAAVQ